jgi:hypothetical protein
MSTRCRAISRSCAPAAAFHRAPQGGRAVLELVLHLRLRGPCRPLARRRSGRVLAYDYHAADRLPGAPILRAAAAEADALMDGIAPPGQVNARLSPGEIAKNLSGILHGYGHDAREVAALLAVQGRAGQRDRIRHRPIIDARWMNGSGTTRVFWAMACRRWRRPDHGDRRIGGHAGPTWLQRNKMVVTPILFLLPGFCSSGSTSSSRSSSPSTSRSTAGTGWARPLISGWPTTKSF